MKLRLILISTLLSVLPLVFLQTYHYYKTEKILFQGRENLLEKDIDSAAEEILDKINTFSISLGLISQLSLPKVSLEYNRPEALKKLLETSTNDKSSLDKIVVFDANGEFFSSSDRSQDVFSLIEKNEKYKEVVSSLSVSNKSELVKIFLNAENGLVSVINAIKISDEAGDLKGYLVAKLKDRVINDPISRLNSRTRREEGIIELRFDEENKGQLIKACTSQANIDEYGLIICRRKISEDGAFKLIRENILILFIVVVFLVVVYGFVYQLLVNRILSPLYKFLENLNRITEGNYIKQSVNSKYTEINKLISSTNSIVEELKESQEQEIEKVKIGAVAKVATQAAHDIRSPLEMLKGIKEDLAYLPEDSRRRFQLGMNRIEEITFNLLKVNKQDGTLHNHVESHELFSLVLSVVTEKKIEYRNREKINIIDKMSSDSVGLFSQVNRNSIKSILSNLINNAVDSFHNRSGEIEVYLESKQSTNIIKIKDNGPGIPQEVASKLFTKGFTTKKNGNGLGLVNAKQDLEAIGGSLSFETEEGKGTTFTITLPKSDTPSSFIDAIHAHNFERIIILDDDPSFHDVWSKRLEGLESKVEHIYSVENMLSKYQSLHQKILLLSDFELMDKSYDGIDTIIKLNHANHSVLVTARSEELEIQERCLKAGIKLLPKSLVNYVKIIKESPEVELTHHSASLTVLIDDDKLIRYNWSSFCEKKGIPFKDFKSIDDFLHVADSIPKDAKIFIDSSLGNNLKGEVESEKIFNLGFKNLYLATGYEKESINKPNWILDVHSKSPEVVG